MTILSRYAKAWTSLLISLLLIIVQYVQGVYSGGIDGIEWLGLLLVLFGPAGLVAAMANTPVSPATKAIVQHVSAVVIVVTQGVIGDYANGISTSEWLGLGLLLVSTLAVYLVPNTDGVRFVRGTRGAAGFTSLGNVGLGLIVLGFVLLILGLLVAGLGVLVTLGWVGIVIGIVLLVLSFFIGGTRRL